MAFAKVGPGVYVRAEDVVAIHAHVEGTSYAVEPYLSPEPKVTIVLRDGTLIPGYYREKIVLDNIVRVQVNVD